MALAGIVDKACNVTVVESVCCGAVAEHEAALNFEPSKEGDVAKDRTCLDCTATGVISFWVTE